MAWQDDIISTGFGEYLQKDCKKCACSRYVDISSDFEEHEWQCDRGFTIHCAREKPCDLAKGDFWEATYHIRSSK